MRILLAALLSFMVCTAFADDHPAPASATHTPTHRYLIERTFPAGALDGLNATTKAQVNAKNASVGVKWVRSFATADKTKTYCIYEAPSEAAVRKAAALNGLPVDRVTEIPVTLLPK